MPFIDNYSSHIKHKTSDYFNYDLLKRFVYRIDRSELHDNTDATSLGGMLANVPDDVESGTIWRKDGTGVRRRNSKSTFKDTEGATVALRRSNSTGNSSLNSNGTPNSATNGKEDKSPGVLPRPADSNGSEDYGDIESPFLDNRKRIFPRLATSTSADSQEPCDAKSIELVDSSNGLPKTMTKIPEVGGMVDGTLSGQEKFQAFKDTFLKEVWRVNCIYVEALDDLKFRQAWLTQQSKHLIVRIRQAKSAKKKKRGSKSKDSKERDNGSASAGVTRASSGSGNESENVKSDEEESCFSTGETEGTHNLSIGSNRKKNGVKGDAIIDIYNSNSDSDIHHENGSGNSDSGITTGKDSGTDSIDGGDERDVENRSSHTDVDANYSMLKNDEGKEQTSSKESSKSNRTSRNSILLRHKLTTTVYHLANTPRTLFEAIHPINEQSDDLQIFENSFKRNITDLYHMMIELKNFRVLNQTALHKILKKWDKINYSESSEHGSSKGDIYRAYPHLLNECKDAEITNKKVESSLMKECVSLYAQVFCHNDELEAYGKLILSKSEVDSSSDMILGVIIGVLMTLVISFIFDVTTGENIHELWQDPAVYIFSVIGGFLIYCWGWTFNIIMWRVAGVNFMSLLRMNIKTNHTLSVRALSVRNSSMTVVLVLTIILFVYTYKAKMGYGYTLLSDVDYWIWPVLLFYSSIALVLLTYIRSNHTDNSGIFDIETIVNCLSFLRPSSPKDRYAGDVMTSLSVPYLQAVFASCYVIREQYHADVTRHDFGVCASDSVLHVAYVACVLPYVIRMCQTLRRLYDSGSRELIMWPHSINIIKYALLFLKVTMGFFIHFDENLPIALQVIYITTFVLSTLWAAYFDIYGDWGLGHNIPYLWAWRDGTLMWHVNDDSNTPYFLRDEKLLMYHNHTFYYFVLTTNLIFRAIWTLSLVNITQFEASNFGLFAAVIELTRRALWGCLKLEWDHCTSSSAYERKISSEVGSMRNVNPTAIMPHFETAYYDTTTSEHKTMTPALTLLCILVAINAAILYTCFYLQG